MTTQLLETPALIVGPPPSDAGDDSGGMSVRISFELLALGLLAFFLAAMQVHPEKVGDVGLVAQAGPVYWFAVLCVSAVFTVNLVRTPHRSVVLAASVLTLLFMIYGLGSVTETAPRFQVAWLHAGFIEYISRTGRVLPSFDARFSWPGAFSFAAFADTIARVPSAVTLIRWAPLVFGVLYLPPLWSVASSLTPDVRVRWLTLWIFAIGNWVGQDYLSPQAAAYILFLVILMILLRWFRPRVPGYQSVKRPGKHLVGRLLESARRVSRAPNEVESEPVSGAVRASLTVIVIALFAVLVISHQLTPVFLIGLIMVLVVTKRLDLQYLPLIFILLFIGWVSWGAIAFWQGHLSSIVGGFGNTGSNVNQNVGTHFKTKNTGREVILFTRVAMTGALLLLAGAGVLLRRSLRQIDLTVILGALAPFPVVLVQAYGGEALLRAYLCALPFMALLVAHALVAGPLRAALRQPRNPAAPGARRVPGGPPCAAVGAVPTLDRPVRPHAVAHGVPGERRGRRRERGDPVRQRAVRGSPRRRRTRGERVLRAREAGRHIRRDRRQPPVGLQGHRHLRLHLGRRLGPRPERHQAGHADHEIRLEADRLRRVRARRADVRRDVPRTAAWMDGPARSRGEPLAAVPARVPPRQRPHLRVREAEARTDARGTREDRVARESAREAEGEGMSRDTHSGLPIARATLAWAVATTATVLLGTSAARGSPSWRSSSQCRSRS